MGWDFGWPTKKALTSELRKGAVASRQVGQVLWTVHALSDGPIIVCHLIKREGGVYGVKSMDESMEPCCYTCPVEWFDTYPTTSAAALRWRAVVKARQEERVA